MDLYGSLVANEGSGGGTVDVPIESISVNGQGVAPVNKNVNIDVPTKISELDDDSNFASKDEIPTKTSELENDSNFASTSDIPTKTSQLNNDSNFASTTDIPTKVSELDNDSKFVTEDGLTAKGYASTSDIPTKVSQLTNDSNFASTSDIPTKTSQLENDSSFVTESYLTAKDYADKNYVGEQIAQSDHLKREIVTVLPEPTVAGEHTIYMLKDDSVQGNDKYKEYMLIDGVVQCIGDTSVDLTDYAKTADVNTELDKKVNTTDIVDSLVSDATDKPLSAAQGKELDGKKVDKVGGMTLSSNDYTDEEKLLVATIEDKVDKTSIATALDGTVTDEQVASALLTKTGLDKKVDKTSIATELSDTSTDDEVVGALTAYNELQKLESANKEQFSTAIGDSITVTDSVDGNIIELGVKGNSFQPIYSGRNLLNVGFEIGTKNGITCTNNGDWTYTLNGTATAKCTFMSNTDIFIKKGTYKFVGTPPNISGANMVGPIFGSVPYEGVVITLDKDVRIRTGIEVKYGTKCVNAVFKPMITTDLNATYDDFEPYVGGSPSPTQSNPQEIKSVGEDGRLVIKSRGKNMIPFPYYSGMSLVHNGITFTANEDGSVTANGTATSNAFFRFANKDMYSLENGKTYAISRGKTKDICMFVQNSSGDFVLLKVEESAKFTCNDTWRYIGCYVPKDTTVTNETIYPMLVEVNEDGTYQTEYEPYKSSTSTIPLYEPLRAIGDIKDEITYKDGEWGVLRRIGSITFDGYETWNASTTRIGRYSSQITNIKQVTDTASIGKISLVMSNRFIQALDSIDAMNNGTIYVLLSEIQLNTTYESLDDFKSWLESNPVTVNYELATPTFEPFADQTLPYISTYDGVTNISNDDELSAEMTVKYPTTDASGVGSRNESKIARLAKNGETLKYDVARIKNVLGDLTFSVSGTTLTIKNGINTWTLEANK